MDLGNIKGVKVISQDEPIPAQPLKIIIYGYPGMGKTSLAATAPHPFIFDFDNGLHRMVQDIRPFGIRIEDYQGALDLVDGPLKEAVEKGGYNTCVVDTVGTMLDNSLAPWLIAQNAKNGTGGNTLSMAGWGALGVEFNSFARKLNEMGLHVVFVCHAKEDEKNIVLDVKGGSKTVLYQSADLIGFIEMNGKKRVLSFDPQQGRIGKNVGGLPDFVVPDSAKPEFADLLTRIIEQAQEAMSRQTSAQAEAVKKVKALRGKIENVETFQQLEKINAEIQGLSPMYKAQLGTTWLVRYGDLYAAVHLDGLESREEFNDALVDAGSLEDKQIKKEVWTRMQAAAAAKGFDYSKEDSGFVDRGKEEGGENEEA